ncbi:BREX system P-loop protein BrxC [Salicibibacter kimchii]|uniref:BREX system P-loop protein BrxC n=1 Tax=Salicibibacter kimchii TaxID=2099786 RepID=A0A345BXB6_9BACI|nr:BREX system P-loop protein BrxC [Salicibibacter kimchii]AXF55597.1 BREX system P-loop protein BrxC [Salicibibacter kimchii]
MDIHTIESLFHKNINRDIQGVIKVDDAEESVFQELDEYVVTEELTQHFYDFFQAYSKSMNRQTDKMGVWISGFFGSGKSHFLKILSYLLDSDRSIDGMKPVDFFTEKVDHPELLSWMKQASDIPNDIVLFNVDSKSDAEGKQSREAIVKVFNKVFNEMRGFSGANPWLANLEETLEKNDQYERFKDTFHKQYGGAWEDHRDDIYYIEDYVVSTLEQVTEMSEDAARNWIRQGPDTYSISIESFAKRVNDYVKTREEGYRLIFLADEMGQYISANTNLMLNLQTVVEDLGKLTRGKVWVIVTSQQDIDSIKKNLQSNDFSKIQGRFDTRLSLSSANVDEVIQKRILAKTEGAAEGLRQRFYQNEAHLKNIFEFSDQTAEMRSFESADDYAAVYPFVPYQFNLLQRVFTAVREHGASGKHLAEGERSLLSAFKEAAIQYEYEDLNTLVPFSAFYATIDSFLENTVRSVIIQAEQDAKRENHPIQEQDVEVLKLLFLIRYVKQVPSTLDNITTLMIDRVDAERLDLKKSIQGSLNRLLSQYLIQSSGEEYLFLTNEEQDVNNEINRMDVATSEVVMKIGERIFTDIFPDRKYRYSPNYDFAFDTWMDERSQGSLNAEIGITILTPYYEGELTPEAVRFMSTQKNTVIVQLPEDISYFEEMEDILKIQRYLRNQAGQQQDPRFDEIRARKNREMNEKNERIGIFLEEAIAESTIVVHGAEQEMKTKRAAEKLREGLKTLIQTHYSKLGYVVHIHTVDDLKEIQQDTQLRLEGGGEDPNVQATEEILRYLDRFQQMQQVTLREIIDRYNKAPFGWKEPDILASLLRLLRDQELKLLLNQELLHIDDEQLIKNVTTRNMQDRVLAARRKRINHRLIKGTQEVLEDLFGVRSFPSDEDGLMKEAQRRFENELKEVQDLLKYYHKKHYPQKAVLEAGERLFTAVIQIRQAEDFYSFVDENEDEFLDYAEEVGRIKDFFKNQVEIYDSARDAIQVFENSRAYITDDSVKEIVDQMQNVTAQEKPYNQIQELPQLREQFNEQITDLLEHESAPVWEKVNSDWGAVKDVLDESPDAKEKLYRHWESLFENIKTRLERSNEFATIISLNEESQRSKLSALQEIDRFNNELIQKETERRKQVEKTTESPAADIPQPEQAAPKVKAVPQQKTITLAKKDLMKQHGMVTIKNQDDINEFLEEIRKELEKQLDEETIIRLM